MTNNIGINERVNTPDGEGIVKRIEAAGEDGNNILYTCVLKVPFIVTNPWQNKREYHPDKPFMWGFGYQQGQISRILS